METITSLDRKHLWQLIQALSLNTDNKIWLAQKLINEARVEQEEEQQQVAEPPCQYGMEEAKQILQETEQCFARGEYITEEEMDQYLQTLS